MPSITITFDTTQAARATPAFKAYLRLDHDPSLTEVKGALVDFARSIVRAYEQEQNIGSLPPPDPFDPT